MTSTGAWARSLAVAALVWAGPATSAEASLARLAGVVNAPSAREAIARVAYAEAAGQGDAGLAGVVFTLLNRLESGAWGSSVEAVVNARSQFEPVMRAGGDWRGLPPASPAQRARIDTILNLALEGRLPDLTGGARYFQNPAIVARRARDGEVPTHLVHFGGVTPSAVIGDHSFYVSTGRGGLAVGRPVDPYATAGGGIFVVAPRVARPPDPIVSSSPNAAPPPGERGLFVLQDGQVAAERIAGPIP
jgi:N-acetylmuramoyl-L-alanine amidase